MIVKLDDVSFVVRIVFLIPYNMLFYSDSHPIFLWLINWLCFFRYRKHFKINLKIFRMYFVYVSKVNYFLERTKSSDLFMNLCFEAACI